MSVAAVEKRTTVADVIVTDDGAGQGRSALAAVRALAAAGYLPAVARSGRWSLAAASRHAAHVVDVGPVDGDGYPAAIDGLARDLGVVPVFPSSDAALIALGGPVADLVDKTILAERAAAVGLRVPATQVFDSFDALERAAGSFAYPVVVKQPVSRVPARKIGAADEIAVLAGVAGRLLVQPFAEAPLRAVGGVVWRGRLVAAVHQRYVRTWPVDCGTASAAITVEPDAAVEHRLTALLDGYDGIFQAQFAGEELLDLNPRVYGSLPLAVAAGANLPAVVCALQRGEDVPLLRARAGFAYRWFEGDVRSVAALVRAGRMTIGEAVRALAPRRGSAHSVASLRDPRPLVTRARYAMKARG